MISEKMQDAINRQIVAELYSGYLYLSMAAWFESTGLKGFAQWMKMQALEEQVHAMKFFNYINERGGTVILGAIDQPQTSWKDPLDVFNTTYAHEQKVTSLINDLVDLAIAERDHASNSFLQWYVDEQVEEESSASDVVDQLKLVGDAKDGLFMLDKELGTRTFVYPPPALGGAV